MNQVDHYFDFVSPFAYLLHEQLGQLPNETEIQHVPVLFAGLLKHWRQVGPVELESKRLFTYQHTTWIANKLGIEFRTPDPHPFNPLPYLRLSIALKNKPEVVAAIYRTIWTENVDANTPKCFNRICEKLELKDTEGLITNLAVKESLKANTQNAIDKGVFGVPTLMIGSKLFWGLDSLDFAIACLTDDTTLESDEMQRLGDIRYGAKRV